MALLLDTQVLVWIGENNPRLSRNALEQIIENTFSQNKVSAVTAFEFNDLYYRGRFGPISGLGELLRRIEAEVLPFPADCWQLIAELPDLHRDPVDRMLIAHAIHANLTLVTSDAVMRNYPVRSLW